MLAIFRLKPIGRDRLSIPMDMENYPKEKYKVRAI
jgi:hypothetical protein